MNNKCKFLIVLSLIFIVATLQVHAEKSKGVVVKNSPKASSECLPSAKTTEISLNHVRALLKTNGTMWFREKAEYEVPKGSGKTSMFSAALWIGGVDIAGQLYVAAMRFGQVGNDYWTGPLKMKDGSIDPPSCSYYDNFYTISRAEVERHIRGFQENDASYMGNIPKSITSWPATGRKELGESWYLAPFCKVATSDPDPSVYDPLGGDYPYYDFDNDLCPWTDINKLRAMKCPWLDSNNNEDPFGKEENPDALPLPKERVWTRQNQSFGWDNKQIYADHVLKGDETVFWFLNDRGGAHSESKSPRSIGLEIRVQAFAFATNDELNKMTFYSYEIINRGSNTLFNTYFSQWVDPDLGYAYDDYVGCDVNRGMGYCYNGKEIDGQGEVHAYGANPPAVGVDFFQGPYIDPDGTDNPKFYKELADINGNQNQVDYCMRFVHHIFNNPDVFKDDDQLLDKFLIVGKDTIRWNDQFAINGVNFGDGIVDNERFGMRRFVYHNNDGTNTGDPEVAIDYYNMLQGKWRNGSSMSYGGNAETNTTGIPCDFMFPRGTDYCNWGTNGKSPGKVYGFGGRTGNWSEEQPNGENSQGNPPADRRFMQSAGPFTLKQGACNYITVGIPWARATQGGVAASVALLMVADDKCQALFENCFKVLDGPDAPNLTIREYDQKLILLLTNSPLSNNKNEDYREYDGTIPELRVDIRENIIYQGKIDSLGQDTIIYGLPIYDTVYYDRYYHFEGYQIYQVIGPEVGANDLEDPNLARIVKQYDIVNYNSKGNPVGTLINWEFDETMQLSVPKVKVIGTNSGIEHSFEITQDAFASGNKQLINYKTYYFVAIAYAYNEYLPFSIDVNSDHGLEGQKLPYLRGRKTADGRSVIPIAAVPHPPSLHGGGATINCDYGYIPNITRVDGQGNGGIALELDKQTIDKILSGGDNGDYRVRELTYEKNAGPLNIKVIDPLRLKPFDFTLIIRDSILDNPNATDADINNADVSNNAYWVLSIDPNVSDKELIDIGLVDSKKNAIREFVSQSPISVGNEQLILPLGISIQIKNADFINRQPSVLENWDRILKKFDGNLYKTKLLYCQSEKIDLENDVIFENNGVPWISGLATDPPDKHSPSKWIRTGDKDLGVWEDSNQATLIQVYREYDLWRLESAFYLSAELIPLGGTQKAERAFKDYTGKFGTLCGGTWAPYVLTSPYDNCPQAKYVDPEPGPNMTNPFYYYAFQTLADPLKQPAYNQTMTNLYSVDVVLTPNQDLWTRCIVLESCPDKTKSQGGALKNEPRKCKSVGKDGNPDNSSDGFGENGDEGMGWFPGYAINIETGERLNIMFSENSDSTLYRYKEHVNGNDMIFNPTSTYALTTKDVSIEFEYNGINQTYYFPEGYEINRAYYDFLYEFVDMGTGELESKYGIVRIWGGMHYVYVCNSSGNTSAIYYLHAQPSPSPLNNFLRSPRRNFNLNDVIVSIPQAGPNNTPGIYGGYIDSVSFGKQFPVFDCGPYDEGRWLVQKFKQVFAQQEPTSDARRPSYRLNYKMQLFSNVMYTYIPLQPNDPDLKKAWMSCDATFKIRVTRPYMRYISRWYESPELRNKEYTVPDEFDFQKGYPIYKVSTKALAPTFNDSRLYQSILDNINIVPNPYYGGSFYEKNSLETTVKIINLPTNLKNDAPVTINIFTVSGILVRTLTKGDHETSYINWDLKNYANIPISGGVYIIHVNCPGIGERMLKFFCTMRPTDLNTF
ncbi:MAG: hypothetical protein LBU83_13115 [Bacteroidales bacterium]|jgi:hypothetical protein|nr:hypothetical protein [Bacteroidales bacterium]